MKDQDERHELLGRLETPPEFKDWASNTLPTPGISNGHQTMTEGRDPFSQHHPLVVRIASTSQFHRFREKPERAAAVRAPISPT